MVRWALAGLGLVVIAQVAASAAGRSTPAGEAIGTVVQVALVAGLVGLVVRRLGLADRLGRRGRIASLSVATLALVGHHVGSLDLYPFAEWDMYTAPTSEVGYFQVTVDDGRTTGPLRIDRAVEVSSSRSFHHQLGVLASAASQRDEFVPLLRDLMLDVAEASGQHDLLTGRVERCRIGTPTDFAPVCDVVIAVDLRPTG